MPVTLALSAEYEVLLDAMHGSGESSEDPRARCVQWETTLELASWHRLRPVLYAHASSGDTVLPARVMDELERAYLDNAARNMLVGAWLRRVLRALGDAAIPAMLLKGAALIESVYPDPALREMVDLDILVPADALDAANGALAAIGLTPALPIRQECDTPAWMRRNHIHDPVLSSADGIAAVELHHHIAIPEERANFTIDGVWERARQAPGGDHLLPSPEDLLLHVCFHFTRNRTGRSDGALGQICDISYIVRHEPVDWAQLTAIVCEYRLQARVFLALLAARELGVAVCEQALHDLRPPGFDPRMGRRLLALRVLHTGERFPLRSLRWMMVPPRQALVEGWGATPHAGPLALGRAYLRRARAHLPHARSALQDPRAVLWDHLLNGQIRALERRTR